MAFPRVGLPLPVAGLPVKGKGLPTVDECLGMVAHEGVVQDELVECDGLSAVAVDRLVQGEGLVSVVERLSQIAPVAATVEQGCSGVGLTNRVRGQGVQAQSGRGVC
jgi:hypothetical protein